MIVVEEQNDIMSAFVLKIVGHQTGDMPTPEPMITKISGVI